MKYKDGVIHLGRVPQMRAVDKHVDEIWAAHDQEAVMTAGLDGKHSEWSWHKYGCASDYRTRYFSRDEAAEVAAELSAALRPLDRRYQVVLHAGSHIHVEWDIHA